MSKMPIWRRRNLVIAMMAVLTIGAFAPAAAQFKGLGEKLLDRAKDEVENAIAKELDEPEENEAAKSDDPSTPADASKPVATECHEVSSVNYFTHDLTQFTYCNNSPSEVKLSVQAMASAPSVFQSFSPENIAAEIRLDGQSVSARPGGKRPQKDPRDPARHTLIIESPADAMKVARAINSDQSFEIVLTGPADEQMVAFSGTFAEKLPQNAVVASAAKTAEVKPAAKSKTTVTPTTVTPTQESKPKPENLTYADPLGKACARDSLTSGLYDCGCIDGKAMQIRQNLSDKQFAEVNEKRIPYRENQLRLLEERLAKETDPNRIESMKRSIARAKDKLEQLKIRPDPMSYSVSAVAMDAYKGASCKIGDYFREKEKKDCLASVSHMPGVADPEAYCACSAKKAAELWLQSDEAFKSSLVVQTVTRARQACRG